MPVTFLLASVLPVQIGLLRTPLETLLSVKAQSFINMTVR